MHIPMIILEHPGSTTAHVWCVQWENWACRSNLECQGNGVEVGSLTGLGCDGHWCNRFEPVAAGETALVVASEPRAAHA